jgi:hypothetical protein
MKERIKWTLVGFGITFGLQVLIGQILRLFTNASTNQDTYYFIIVGGTLGTFLVGGMVIGLMLDERAVLETIIAAISALVLNAVLSRVGVSHNPLFFAESNNAAWSAIVVVIAVILAIAGSLIGGRISAPQSDWVSNTMLVVGLIAVVVGPYVLFIKEVPVFALVIIGVVMLAGVGIAIWLFTHESHPEDEISISPDHHHPNR